MYFWAFVVVVLFRLFLCGKLEGNFLIRAPVPQVEHLCVTPRRNERNDEIKQLDKSCTPSVLPFTVLCPQRTPAHKCFPTSFPRALRLFARFPKLHAYGLALLFRLYFWSFALFFYHFVFFLVFRFFLLFYALAFPFF